MLSHRQTSVCAGQGCRAVYRHPRAKLMPWFLLGLAALLVALPGCAVAATEVAVAVIEVAVVATEVATEAEVAEARP